MGGDRDSPVVLYLGTTKVAAFRAALGKESEVRINAWRVKEPAGFHAGLIRDLEKAERDLKEVLLPVTQPKEPSDFPLYVILSNSNIKTTTAAGSIYFPSSKVITSQEVSQVIRQTREIATVPLSEKIFASELRGFLVDDIPSVESPLGLTAHRLGVTLELFTLPFSIFQAFERLLIRLELEPLAWVSRSIASSYGVLREEEKREGVCLIELGGHASELLFFKNSLLEEARILPWGAESLTEELASEFKIAAREARRLKEKYGNLQGESPSGHQWLPVGESDGQKASPISLADFQEKLKEAAQRMLERLHEDLSHGSERNGPVYSVVLSGGGAALEGLLELAEQTFGLPVRLGLVGKVEGPSELISFPRFASVLGFFRQQADQCESEAKSDRESGPVLKTVGKIREWILEYF